MVVILRLKQVKKLVYSRYLSCPRRSRRASAGSIPARCVMRAPLHLVLGECSRIVKISGFANHLSFLQMQRVNGLELSGPAEAGKRSPTLRHAGRPGKPHLRPSPPGQLQRVVSLLIMPGRARGIP